MLSVGKKLPEFKLKATISNDQKTAFQDITNTTFKGKWLVLFFYPKDFTFVCPTEIHAFQEKLAEFEQRDTIVIGCSTDTEETHMAWLATPIDNGGIEGITFPLIADTSKIVSKT